MRSGLVFYDNVTTLNLIAQIAYFKWLDGSSDSTKNWLDAEKEVKLLVKI